MDAPKGLFLSGALPRSLRKPTKRYVKTHELYQLGFVNVLPRDREVVALKVPSKATRKDGSYAIKDTARIFVVENPHCDQTTVMSSPAKGAPSKLGEAVTTMQVVEYVLDQWTLARDRGGFNLSFNDHVTNTSTLIQRIYGESDEERRFLLRGLVEDYVLLACHRKTIRRLNLGKMDHKRGRNFFTALTLPTTDFPTINDQSAFDIDDIPRKEFLSALPTKAQARALRMILNFRHEVSEDEILSQPIYGLKGRHRLHTALSELLSDANEFLSRLRDATDISAEGRGSKEGIMEIADLTRYAKTAVRQLTLFSRRFERVLLEHFNWLNRTLWIDTSTNLSPFKLASKLHDAPGNSERREADEANTDALENHEEYGDDTRELENAIDALHAELHHRNVYGISVWAREAFAYINLVSLHDQSLCGFTNRSKDKRLSERLRDCRVTVTTMQRAEFEKLHPQWARCVRYHELRSSSSITTTTAITTSNSDYYGSSIATSAWPTMDASPTPQSARALFLAPSPRSPKRPYSAQEDVSLEHEKNLLPSPNELPSRPASPLRKRPRL